MDLETAIGLVAAYMRAEGPDPDMSNRKAVESERSPETGCDHDDVDAVIDDPELRQAYHKVLDASADEINRALNN